MKWYSSRKIAVMLALALAAGLTVYYFHSRDEAPVAAAPVPRAQGVYTAHELAAAVAKYPAVPDQPAEAAQPDPEFVAPEPDKSRGHAKSAEDFRAAMDDARKLQSEWKLFTNEHRSVPRHEWNGAVRQWQQAHSSRLDSVRDQAGITFPLRHPSDEPPGINNDTLLPDYLNPQRAAPLPPNVQAFRRERDRLAAARDTVVHSTEGLPPAQRMQKVKEWDTANGARVAASRSTAFMLEQLPLELVPPTRPPSHAPPKPEPPATLAPEPPVPDTPR